MRYVILFKIISIILFSTQVWAGTPTVTTFQTRITTPTGAALEAASVNFRFTILDSAGTCALYVEDYANVNMSGSSGIVSFSLGGGSKQYPAGVISMYEVFNNSAPSFPCQAGGSYVPGPTDRRQIVMQFNDGSGWQTLPQLAINSVFYSNYALRSDNLGSYPANDYLRPVTLPTCTASQSLRWDGTTFTCIAASGGGGGGAMTGVTSITNASGDITMAPASGTGAVFVNSNVPSTSTTTGAFVVTGGVGVSGAINAAGNITSSGNISTSGTIASTGSILSTTSVYSPQLYGTSTVSGNIKVDGTSNATKGNVLLASAGGRVGVGTTTPSGIFDVQGGTAFGTNGLGINLVAQDGSAGGNFNGGSVNLTGGNSVGSGTAGDINITSGGNASTDKVGNILISTPRSAQTIPGQGDITIMANGYGGTTHGAYLQLQNSNPRDAKGGDVVLRAGNGNNLDDGAGSVFITGGHGLYSMPGGNVTVSAGDGGYTGGFNANGGDLFLKAGAKSGTGALGRVVIAQNGGYVGIGTTSPTYALSVSGDVNVSGNFRVNGTVLTAGGGSTQTGVTSISNASGDITLAPAVGTGAVQINSGAASTSPTTGALIVSGGVGVSGGIYSGGAISSGSTVSANTSMFTPQLYGTSTPSGNILIDGTSNAAKGNVILANAGGSVGIGTTTPSQLLHVAGIARIGDGTIRMGGSGWGEGGGTNIGIGNTVGYNNSTAIGNGNSTGSADGATAIGFHNTAGSDTGTAVGFSNSAGWHGASFGYLNSANIAGAVAIGSSNTVTAPNAIVIGSGITNAATSTLMIGPSDTAKMTIASTGNVGIGTTTPNANLNIYSTSAVDETILRVDSVNNASRIEMTAFPGGDIHKWYLRNFTNGGGSNFFQLHDAWNSLIPIQIESNSGSYLIYGRQGGNVGVGTNTPNYKLDVAGDVNVSGNFRVNGVVLTGGGGANQTGVTSISNASGDITLAPAVSTGAVQVNSGAASTSPTTGALIVSGGIGVSGGVYSGGAISAGSSVYAVTSMFSPQLYGTSTPSGNILIDGTSNATKGNVILAGTGGKVAVGTTTPSATFQVVGTNGTGTSPNAPMLFSVSGGHGYASGNGNGGVVSITAGTSSGTGTAGTVAITGGTGTSGAGGGVTIAAGSGDTGSDLVLKSGDNWARNGANALITLGAAGTVTTGGITIQSGNSNGSAGSNTGAINIFTPNANAGYTSTAGNINLTAGNGQFGGVGGAVNITAGNGGATNVNGSNVVITAGAKGGSGTDGNILLAQTRGNVGIGVASPTYKLEVDGHVRTTGRIEAGDYIVAGARNDGAIVGALAATNYSPSNGSGARLTFETYNNGYAGIVDPAIITGVLVNGTNGSERGDLYFSTLYNAATNEKMRLTAAGNLGVGTSTPSEKVHVIGNVAATGQIAGGSQTITGGTTAIDWNNGNAIMTDYDCGSQFQMANLRDGGSYTLVVTGTGTTQCNFSTTTTGTGAATVNYRFKPTNAARTASSYTVYTFLRVGTTVLVSWTSGF